MKKLLILAALLALASCNSEPEQKQLNILSHRGWYTSGGQRVTDENSLDALRRAQEMKCDGVEFDVHLTADDQMVIRHDNKIDETLSCQGSTFEQIRAIKLPFGNQIPSLHEWLAQAKETPELKLFLEIKAHERSRENKLVGMILDEVKAMGMEDQVSYLSFSIETCDYILSLNPKAKVTLNGSKEALVLTPDEAKAHGYSGISYQFPLLLNHPEWAERCKELGLDNFFWMTNNLFLRRVAEEIGCNWFTTDYYDLLKY